MKKAQAQSSNLGPNDDLNFLMQDINKNIIKIYKIIYDSIIEKQKELKKTSIKIEKRISLIPVVGNQLSNSLKPYIALAISLANTNPVELALKLNNLPILQIYDLLDNAGIIPDINNAVSEITNIYDWLQVFADIIPIYNSVTNAEDVDPYHYIELANDFYNAVRENPAMANQQDLSTLISTTVTLFSKIGAPITRYQADPNRGLNILGRDFISNKNEITADFNDFKKTITSDIYSSIKNNNISSATILNDLESKYSWLKTKVNPTANDLYLKEKTVDLIIEKLKIYLKIKEIFKTFKNPKFDFKWSIIKPELKWEILPQEDKRFAADIVQKLLSK